ncbi:MAG: hypothetical protein DRJ66_00585 [Thermoprotei archaeon]|nr:MAG: hypothetical protein DRJ66_00585 [Thermoprotei archaeon]RLF19447.1 MAG: hypothetical protein DRZ82_05750 [Thermoprotei archaeon]
MCPLSATNENDVLDTYKVNVYGVELRVIITKDRRYIIKEPNARISEKELIEMIKRIREGKKKVGIIRDRILKYTILKEQGLKEIEPLLHDPLVEDIFIDEDNVDVIHSKFGLLRTNIKVNDIFSLIERIALLSGVYVNYAMPRRRITISRGRTRFRVSIALAPEAASKTSIAIRRLDFSLYPLPKLIAMKCLPPIVAAYIISLMNLRRTGLITGVPSSGKTTIMVSFLPFIQNVKIVLIQHSDEIYLPPQYYTYESLKVDYERQEYGSLMDNLDMAVLERSPGFIVIDDLHFDSRGNEPWALLQFGRIKCGMMVTLHGESPIKVLGRFATRPIFAGIDEICEAIDYIVVMSYDNESRQRYVNSLYVLDGRRMVNIFSRLGDKEIIAHPGNVYEVEPIRNAIKYANFIINKIDDEEAYVQFIFALAGFLERVRQLKPNISFDLFTKLVRELVVYNFDKLVRKFSDYTPPHDFIDKPLCINLREVFKSETTGGDEYVNVSLSP